MAKLSNIVKKKVKYDVQKKNRCSRCGRAHAYIRKFGLCRLCFRQFAHEGLLPGVKKASW